MRRIALVTGVVAVLAGCGSEFVSSTGDGGYTPADGWSAGPCEPGKDSDGDGIPDEVEGCGKDTDGDGIPDYADTDSDNDKVLDKIEAGPDPTHPVDSDGDGTPDFQDNDSDGDGIKDGDEDLNGDGKLGCCLVTCGEVREGCKAEANGCGKGQTCTAGKCTPAAEFLCADGETNPLSKVTFPGGKADQDLPTFVCHKPDEVSGKGLKPLDFKKSTAGKWKVALEKGTVYGEIAIEGGVAPEAGACIDLSGPGVAGFVISMAPPGSDGVAASGAMITKLGSLAGKSTVTQLSSGTPGTSHDKYPTVVSTQLGIKMSASQKAPAVRNAVFSAILGKKVSQLSQASYGPSATDFVLLMQTLLRKDGRLILMGAVADTASANNATLQTGFILDDLSNGTGLATDSDSDTVECDPFKLEGNPVADIIWVIDESGSMSDNRQDVANNAKDFFSRALKSGLDFRIAVTGVNISQNGKFCSTISTDSHDTGGVDRFLTSAEQAIFAACAINPPGYEGGSEYGVLNARKAVENHLPRTANNQAKIRPDAKVVVIIATDEADQDWKKKIPSASSYYKTCVLPANIQTQSDALIAADVAFFQQNNVTVHLIGGVCNNTCGAEIAHPYLDLVKATKGISAEVCQKNLGASLQIMIDTIAGSASPAILQYVPISASIAVAVDQTQLQRSRVQGFDYVSSSNSLVFIGIPFPKGSLVVASYRRWVAQATLE